MSDFSRVETLYPGTESAKPSRLLFDTGVCGAPTKYHGDVASLPQIDLIAIENGAVTGMGVVLAGGKPIISSGIYPRYFKSWLNDVSKAFDGVGDYGNKFWLGTADINQLNVVSYSGDAIYGIHPNMIYGHFLLEMLPKLLVLDERLPKEVPIICTSRGPAWLIPILNTVFPSRPLLLYDHTSEMVAPTRIFTCSAHFDDGHHFHLATREILSKWQTEFIFKLGSPLNRLSSGRKIYLSRSLVKAGWHRISNEEELEKTMLSLGVEIVHPEKLSFSDQVQLFAQCDLIVGEFSSAMHNSIFAPKSATIVCLNWINWYQSRLCNLWEQSVGFIAPKKMASIEISSLKRLDFSIWNSMLLMFTRCSHLLFDLEVKILNFQSVFR